MFDRERRALGPTVHQRPTTPVALAERLRKLQNPQPCHPADCSPHNSLNTRSTTWYQARLACVSYRVILQGVDPWTACHITFPLRRHALPGDLTSSGRYRHNDVTFRPSPARINRKGASAAQAQHRLEPDCTQGGQARKSLSWQ
jgi:hypothetical protein